MNPAGRRSLVAQAFTKRFGSAPTLWSRAPGRVDLMGSHTDYNHGFVLTMTIDRDAWIAARPRSDRRVVVESLNLPGRGEFGLDDLRRDEAVPWASYVAGVAWAMQAAGYDLSGFDGLVHSTVPFSAGLSSSAALEMATARLFETLGGLSIDPVQLALLGQQAENQFVGMNCGILDQYSSALGQAGSALLLDCRNLTSRPAPIAAGLSIVICDTRYKRELTGSAYGERRAQCEEGAAILSRFDPSVQTLRDVSLDLIREHSDALPPPAVRRCRFIIEENQRVLALAVALTAGDRTAIADLTAASFAGARDLYEITVPQMEAMLAAMSGGPGVVGARQAGAGFGGCMVAVVETGRVEDFADHVQAAYAAAAGIDPAIYPVQAAPGAGMLADPPA